MLKQIVSTILHISGIIHHKSGDLIPASSEPSILQHDIHGRNADNDPELCS